LRLCYCAIDDEGFHLLVDALVGNTTLEVLMLVRNSITKYGLDDTLRLLQFTQLTTIRMDDNHDFLPENDAVMKLIAVLRQHTVLEEFRSDLDFDDDVMAINNLLARNCMLKRANALLALQPRTGLPIAARSGIWYMAIANLPNRGSTNHKSRGVMMMTMHGLLTMMPMTLHLRLIPPMQVHSPLEKSTVQPILKP
jgi:hypothetical protein